jgi:hypothetical protein
MQIPGIPGRSLQNARVLRRNNVTMHIGLGVQATDQTFPASLREIVPRPARKSGMKNLKKSLASQGEVFT